jgi:hypothetical protein
MVTDQVQVRTRPAAAATHCVRLDPVRGCHGLAPVTLRAGTSRVGSSEECDVRVRAGGVAPLHATIDFDGSRARVVANCPLTWLNDGPVRQANLKAGDVLTLGPVEWKVAYVEEVLPPPMHPAAETGWNSSGEGEPAEFDRELRGAVREESPRLAARVAPPVVTPATGLGRAPAAPRPIPQPRPARPMSLESGGLAGRSPIQRAWERIAPPPMLDDPAELLAEAQAAHNLRQDLARLERPVAEQRSRRETLPAAARVPSFAEEELRALRAQLAERERDLSTRTEAMRAGESQLARERETLLREQQRLAEALREVETLRGTCEAEQSSLAEAVRAARQEREEWRQTRESERARLHDLQQELEGQLRVVREGEAALADAQAKLAERQAASDARSAELESQAESLRLRSAELDDRQAALDREIEQSRSRDQELSGSWTEIEDARQELADRQDRLAELQAELARAEGDLGQERDRQDAHAARLAALHDDLARREQEVERLHAEYAAAASTSDDVADDLERLRAERDELQARRAELDQLQEALRNEQARLDAEREALCDDRESAAAERHALAELQEQIARERRELKAELDRLLEERRWSDAHAIDTAVEPNRMAPDNADHPLVEMLSTMAGAAEGKGQPSRADLDHHFIETLADARDEGGGRDLPDDGPTLAADPAPVRSMPASYLEFLEELHVGIGDKGGQGLEPPEDPSESAAPVVGASTVETPASAPRAAANPSGESLAESKAKDQAGESTELRSKLAELFGISQTELDEAAARDHEAAPPFTAAAATPSPEPSVAQTAAARPETPDGDPISAYMRDLLARTNPSVPVPTPSPEPAADFAPPAAAPAPAPLERKRDLEKKDWTNEDLRAAISAIVEDSQSASPPSLEAAPAKPRKKLDAVEREEIRSNLDSMRQIANYSARSAVAQHHSRKLGVSFQVKLTLTILAGIITLALLTADVWGHASYRWQGLGTLIITLISAFELARTMRTLQHVQRKAAQSERAVENTADDAALSEP